MTVARASVPSTLTGIRSCATVRRRGRGLRPLRPAALSHFAEVTSSLPGVPQLLRMRIRRLRLDPDAVREGRLERDREKISTWLRWELFTAHGRRAQGYGLSLAVEILGGILSGPAGQRHAHPRAASCSGGRQNSTR